MNTTRNNQKGFTLIETLVAILILAMAIGALLTLASGGFFTIRYAKNDIVANNLLQESLEYIRNERDTWAQQGRTWTDWIASFPDQCKTDDGCTINTYSGLDPQEPFANSCTDPTTCYMTYFADSGFYGYPGNNLFDGGQTMQQTSFVRTISIKQASIVDTEDPQYIITATMKWMNGLNQKTISQSITLTNWNFQ